jgi:hypothetical protein
MPQFYSVPKGSTPAVCKAADCRRPVYPVDLGGHRHTIDVDVPNGKAPTKLLPGHGVLHSSVCKARKQA